MLSVYAQVCTDLLALEMCGLCWPPFSRPRYETVEGGYTCRMKKMTRTDLDRFETMRASLFGLLSEDNERPTVLKR